MSLFCCVLLHSAVWLWLVPVFCHRELLLGQHRTTKLGFRQAAVQIQRRGFACIRGHYTRERIHLVSVCVSLFSSSCFTGENCDREDHFSIIIKQRTQKYPNYKSHQAGLCNAHQTDMTDVQITIVSRYLLFYDELIQYLMGTIGCLAIKCSPEWTSLRSKLKSCIQSCIDIYGKIYWLKVLLS